MRRAFAGLVPVMRAVPARKPVRLFRRLFAAAPVSRRL